MAQRALANARIISYEGSKILGLILIYRKPCVFASQSHLGVATGVGEVQAREMQSCVEGTLDYLFITLSFYNRIQLNREL